MSTRDSGVVHLPVGPDVASIPFESEVRELNQRMKDITRSIRAFRRYGASINLHWCTSDAEALARCATAVAEAARRHAALRAHKFKMREAGASRREQE
jgi:hypothetical protein